MAKTYTLHVAGLTRELPICKINDHLDIAAFIMFSDVELTIACAKRNPKAHFTGVDRWGKEYADYSQTLCFRNAMAEGVNNAFFRPGDANALPFADGTFDAVVSNYVYHNISGKNKQALLLESAR